MTICCLCHANIIMLSAIWVELSNSSVAPSQVTNMSHRTPDPLHTHTWRIGHETTPKFVIPISIWGTLACLVTVKLEEHLASSLSSPCSSLSQKPLCPQFPWLFSHLRYSVCQLLHRQTSISLMLRHWSWFVSFNMLLAVSFLETASSQQWVNDYMSWVRLAAWFISRLH